MGAAPKWLRPVAVAALLWNLLGCFAYLREVTASQDPAVSASSAAQQALQAPRPAWGVAATALAVWGGALGCLGLILRKRWSNVLFLISLLGVIVQDIGLFGLSSAASRGGPGVIGLQSLVLLIAVGLVVIGRKADANGWLA